MRNYKPERPCETHLERLGAGLARGFVRLRACGSMKGKHQRGTAVCVSMSSCRVRSLPSNGATEEALPNGRPHGFAHLARTDGSGQPTYETTRQARNFVIRQQALL